MKMMQYKVTLHKGSYPFLDEWNSPTEEELASHLAYVEELKAKGEYLQPYTAEVHLAHNPTFDDRSLINSATVQSSTFTFLDFSTYDIN